MGDHFANPVFAWISQAWLGPTCQMTAQVSVFNSALFHAAGHNRSPDIHRMANLLQVSSPFGRAMEALDSRAMSVALYPALQALPVQGALDDAGVGHAAADHAAGSGTGLAIGAPYRRPEQPRLAPAQRDDTELNAA
ncbi:hypothetical protein [Janthinobacterium sp. JC611]|uniref:hypothetical protein n=1 Tax=Janthinobacterium sp. JC611 TaxID=2816201 RepID=UPI001BFE77BB|nr:hypothetical protein [Janthinobacterium sp. JC611]